jgi:TolA-binding protein/negative regulator of sigma E activity
MSERMPAACDARKDDLVALALGESLGSREESVRAHAASCIGCRDYLAGMQHTLGMVRALPRPEPSADLTARILAAARDEAGVSVRGTAVSDDGPWARLVASVVAAFRRPAFASAVAAVAVASAAVAILVLSGPPAESKRGDAGTTPTIARFEPSPSVPPPVFAAPMSDEQELRANRETPAGSAGSAVPRGPELAQRPSAEPSEPPIMAVVTGAPAEPGPAASPESPNHAEQPTHVAMVPPAPARGALGGEQQQADERARRAQESTAAAPVPDRGAVAAPAEADGDYADRFYVGREVATGTAEAGPVGGQVAATDDARDAESPVDLPVTTQLAEPAEGAGGAVNTRVAGAAGLDSTYRSPEAAAPASPPPAVAAQPSVTIVAVQTAGSGPEQPGRTEGWAADEYTEGEASTGAAVTTPSATPAGTEESGYGGFGAPTVPAQVTAPPADDVSVAQQRLDQGDPAQAEDVLEEALRNQDARSADVTFLLAETYARQGKWTDAARTYELFLARYLDDRRADEARWRAAEAYRRAGASTRAASLLEQLVGVPGYDSRARTVLDEMAERPAETTVGGVEAATPAAGIVAEPSTETQTSAPAEPAGPP